MRGRAAPRRRRRCEIDGRPRRRLPLLAGDRTPPAATLPGTAAVPRNPRLEALQAAFRAPLDRSAASAVVLFSITTVGHRLGSEHHESDTAGRAPPVQCWRLAATVAALPASAQTLRFGLAEDPDVLDPTLARTFVGRIVFAALCDKLFDIDEKLNIVPQLAEQLRRGRADGKALTIKLRPGVTFHDGEKLDAAAVKYNIERHKTMPGSNRRGELALVDDRRRRRSDDGAAQPVGAVLAAARAARRPRRHDGVAQGRAGRRRQVRRQARCARARSSSSSASRRTASCSSAIPNYWNKGADPPRQDRLPADRRRDGAPGEPQVRASSTSSSGWPRPTCRR